MVLDGETGFLVARGDPAALANAIARLADDPKLRLRLGEAGEDRVRTHFTLEGMTTRIEAIYRQEYEKACGSKTGTGVTQEAMSS